MSRILRLAVGQLGPIARSAKRRDVVERLISMLREAAEAKCKLIVFPELALTTFFPRWVIEDQQEIDAWFEREMPNPEVQPLFEAAANLGIGFYLGYAELDQSAGYKRHFNASILVDDLGGIIGRYRKIHLPGYTEPQPDRVLQYLEKKYFQVGNYGFPTWDMLGSRIGMCICNDRRWSETYRVMALQGAEMVLLGYNTHTDPTRFGDINTLTEFHNHLVMQASAYQNSLWVLAAARCGLEEESDLIGHSAIIAPSGEIVAQSYTKGDEVIMANCDMDLVTRYREHIFNFARDRKPEHYRLISERAGVGGKIISGES